MKPFLPTILLLSAGALVAGSAPSSVAAGDNDAVSVLGRGVLRKSKLVVRGTIDKRTELTMGVEMATLAVEEVMYGKVPKGERVQVLSNEAGYFDRVAGEVLFFLVAMENSRRFESGGMVFLSGEDGREKLAAIRRSLAVESLPAEKRARSWRLTCFEGLGAAKRWTRRNAARELAHLCAVRPDAFSSGDASEIKRKAARETDPVLRAFLIEAATDLFEAEEKNRLGPSDMDADRVSLKDAPLLRTLKEDPDPARRAAAARRLGEDGSTGSVKLLADALAADKDVSVRIAVVRALEFS
ncbi:MAG: HEAT repeat domain-containing protein [Planctomycetota bacterium]